METVHLATMAMGSRFELVLVGDDPVWLRAAGEEALGEIERLDAQLSIYRESSEVSRLNANAAHGPVRVEARLFRLLEEARRLHDVTEGAFDITVAPLMRAWGFFGADGRMPSPAQVADARSITGMNLVELDPTARSVRFGEKGVMIDLGGIGKGYALDEAIAILREAGVEKAFLHGGTSTSYGLGTDGNDEPWRVAIPYPEPASTLDHNLPLALVPLENASLSVSAVWGKAFVFEGQTYGHVLDPRVGRPVEGALLTAVASPSATEADALSTALLVQGMESGALLRAIAEAHRALLLFPSTDVDRYDVVEAGIDALDSPRKRPTRVRG